MVATKCADTADQVVTVSNAAISSPFIAHAASAHTALCSTLQDAVHLCTTNSAGLNVMFFSHCRYHRMERSSQFVRRTVCMPETANLDQIQAKYDNGVLKLNIPKKEEERPLQRVNIQ